MSMSELKMMRVVLFLYSLNPMFYRLLESSQRDDSNKWPNKGFGEEITQLISIEINFTYLTTTLSCVL